MQAPQIGSDNLSQYPDHSDASALSFLSGDTAAAGLIRRFDWSATLGPIEHWPQSLKTTVGLMVRSPIAIVLLWGPDGIMIYNDAYAEFAGRRHPEILGAKVLEAWPEVADFNANVMRVVMAGGTLTYRDRELALDRRGVMEQGWMDLGYSPVIAENGRPGGVIAIVVETTPRVEARRRADSERERLAKMFEQAPSFMALLDGPEHRFRLTNPGYDRLIGRSDVIGKTVAEALPEVIDQGFVQSLDRVRATGEPYRALEAKVRLRDPVSGHWNIRYLDFVYQPVMGERGTPDGIFLQGVDVTDRVLTAQRKGALAALTEALADAEDPIAMGERAAAVLGRTLTASRVAYANVDADMETVRLDRGWAARGIEPLDGILRFRDYGSFIDDLKRDATVVIPDVRRDARTSAHASAFEALQIGAMINVPVIEADRLVALLFVHDLEPCQRSAEDVALAREFASRTRSAVERARAARDLRVADGRFRFLDDLNRHIGATGDADEILLLTTRMIGEFMNLSVCAYADMDEDQDGFTIRGEWAAPGSPSIVGRYRLADFGALAVANLRNGLPLFINDNERELPADAAAAFQSIGACATICMPLVKQGKLKALMAVHDRRPHHWSTQEVALVREVTERSWAHVERVAAEAEVRASEENFRVLARALPNQVWTADPSGVLDWFNDTVYGYSGAVAGSLDGDRWTGMVHPDDLPATGRRWSEALASGSTYETEFRLRRHDGAFRWHLGRAVPLVSAGKVVRWIGSNTDIQDQKDTQQALSELNATLEQRVRERTAQLLEAEEALRQAQKMEAVGQLTGGIAHDFNNFLQVMSGNLALIERSAGKGSASVERYVSTARSAVQRATALTHRLLAFSRRQTLDPKPTDVNRLIGGMEDLVRRSVGPDVSVEVVGAVGLWVTKVDASQLESALLNLCINARDAMAPHGGRLTIETANKWMDDRAARERELAPGQYLSLCVSDTGTGMTPEVISRAFDPFFTTKPSGQGTGLGLSMVYGFVRQSGGQVRIYSELGKGTTICLYLPRHAGELEDRDALPAAVPIDPGAGETIVVVDDEPAIRRMIADELAEAGYSVIEAGSGAEGLRRLEADLRIDLLITDVGLPGGMNGRQMADAARTTRRELKVLFITGYAENAVLGNGHLDRGMDILTKPFEIAQLTAKVRAILDRG